MRQVITGYRESQLTNDREPAEYVPIEDTFNPLIHRINHAVKHRAIHPERPVPSVPPILLRFSAPPDDLIEKVQSKVDMLVETAEVKKGKHLIRAYWKKSH